MATNNFKAFGIGASANVTSQADYEALAALLTGFQSGKASSAQINKALRQSSTMAYVLAQFISDSASVDVLDNGTPATILANMKAAMTALTPGRLLNIQIITATGTYTKTAGATKGVVEMIGAGAGGTPCAGSNSNTASYSGGGGAGAYCKFLLATLPNTVACTVGSGGVSGNAGGSTTFGSYCTVSGGSIGANGTASTQGIAGGGSGGGTITSSGVTVIDSSKGAPGIYGICINTSGGNGGHGASSLLGQGGKGSPSGAGEAAGGFGAGGGGCFLAAGGATTTQLGGAGSGGVIIVYEYA